jgi:hypothetical protein
MVGSGKDIVVSEKKRPQCWGAEAVLLRVLMPGGKPGMVLIVS